MPLNNEAIDVVLHIDEAKAPLARGQRISGKVVAMVPESRPPSKRDAVMEPSEEAPSFLRGCDLYVSPRYTTETWDDFRAGKAITVNVSLLDSEKDELARAIGTLKRMGVASDTRR